MLEKKLLTLACAIGILACGACFLPPIYPPPPVRPPFLRPELKNIRTLHVEVKDASQPGHLDAARVTKKIAQVIKEQTNGYIVAVGENAPADAVLAVAVTGETATLYPANPANRDEIWLFELQADATVTHPDGAFLWQSHGNRVHFAHAFPPHPPSDLWNEKFVRDESESDLAIKIVLSMIQRGQ